MAEYGVVVFGAGPSTWRSPVGATEFWIGLTAILAVWVLKGWLWWRQRNRNSDRRDAPDRWL
jgi:hypothetical protein